nr:hypothetical protein B0A51_05248 [Rachicladosporium sp. CCFEE 5018]
MACSTVHKNISHNNSLKKGLMSSSSPDDSRCTPRSQSHLNISGPSIAQSSEAPSPFWQFSRKLATPRTLLDPASHTDDTVEQLVADMQMKAKILDDGEAGSKLLGELAEGRKAAGKVKTG